MKNLSDISTDDLIYELQDRGGVAYESADAALSDTKSYELKGELSSRGETVYESIEDFDVSDVIEYLEGDGYAVRDVRGSGVDEEKLCDFLIDNFKREDFPMNIIRHIQEVANRVML